MCCTASRYDVWMILSQRTFNTELRLLHTHDGMVLSVDDLGQFNTDHDVMESVFEIQRRLQSLHLSDEENCVLSAFCVVFTGAFHLSHIIHDMSTLVILSLIHIPKQLSHHVVYSYCILSLF